RRLPGHRARLRLLRRRAVLLRRGAPRQRPARGVPGLQLRGHGFLVPGVRGHRRPAGADHDGPGPQVDLLPPRPDRGGGDVRPVRAALPVARRVRPAGVALRRAVLPDPGRPRRRRGGCLQGPAGRRGGGRCGNAGRAGARGLLGVGGPTMPRRLTRRQFLHAAAGLAAAAAAGCRGGGGKAGPDAGRELRVFVYAGGHERTMRQAFVPRFEAATGAAVTLHAGWWDGIPKLKAAPPDDPPFDLVISDATQGYPAVKDGLFAQLDLANVPNHKALTPAALDNWVFRDR